MPLTLILKMLKDYYYILGIDRKADENAIRHAYKKLTLKLHPDRNAGDAFFENYFKQVQEAYEVLSVPSLRETYDFKWRQQSSSGGKENKDLNLDKPVIHRFTASKNSLAEGELVTLSWEVANTDDVYIDVIGRVEPQGTKTLRLPQLAVRERLPIVLTARNAYLDEDEDTVERTVWILNKNYKGSPMLAEQAESLEDEKTKKAKKKKEPLQLQAGTAPSKPAPKKEKPAPVEDDEDEENDDSKGGFGKDLRVRGDGSRMLYVYALLVMLLGLVALLIVLIYKLYLAT